MENHSPIPTPAPAAAEWTSTKVYTLSAICLILGIALGALFHGPARSSAISTGTNPVEQQMPANPAAAMPPEAAAVVDPVFEKLKSDPNNFDLLSQAGIASMKAGDPKTAADYYGRALKVKDDPDVRINLANAYFRAGDPDRSLAELATVLKADPKSDKALYNTGVVRLMGKRDAKGAIASWQLFLKYHPDHPHKAQVEEMIKRAKQFSANPKG
jgi:tetratricopeptide (TPR) repeat protein